MMDSGFVSASIEELTQRLGTGAWRQVVSENADYRVVVHQRPPGADFPVHEHAAAEVFIVHSGTAEFDFGNDDRRAAGPGTVLATAPYQPHAIRVIGDEALLLVCFGAPNSGE